MASDDMTAACPAGFKAFLAGAAILIAVALVKRDSSNTSATDNEGTDARLQPLSTATTAKTPREHSDTATHAPRPSTPNPNPYGDYSRVSANTNSSQVPIVITPADSKSDPDLARRTLAQNRTTDHIGRPRTGLVPPPVFHKGNFRHERTYLVEGGRKPGLYDRASGRCPRTPRLVVLDGREDGLEGMEELRL